MKKQKSPLVILHTSDWHLGRRLYGRKRHEEFEAFLEWLLCALEKEKVDALLVAGDVFDSSVPDTHSQTLYYRFLRRAAETACRHVAIIGGNHDSASFLDAPKELLKTMDVHVLGASTGNPEDEVLVLRDARDRPELIVCAAPFLRERDVRRSEAGESPTDKARKTCEGIREHYRQACALAFEKKEMFGGIPVVAMGHLFAAGGMTVEGDGVRELQVGSLSRVPADTFPQGLDYVALGHLHVPQKVNGLEWMRYSGSPLPMGFGEARQQKSVCLVRLEGEEREVRQLPVPVFQKLERVRGGRENMLSRMRELAALEDSCWVEALYEGDEIAGDLREEIEEAVAGSRVEVLRVSNKRLADRVLGQEGDEGVLADFDVSEVFERLLDAENVPEEQRPELLARYAECLAAVLEDRRRL